MTALSIVGVFLMEKVYSGEENAVSLEISRDAKPVDKKETLPKKCPSAGHDRKSLLEAYPCPLQFWGSKHFFFNCNCTFRAKEHEEALHRAWSPT